MNVAGRHVPIGSTDHRLDALLGRLTLEERVRVLTGETLWTLYPLPSAGLRTLTLSDGPIGVRGRGRAPTTSAQMPAPSALAATWDEELARESGRLMAAEAHAKNADVVLAPVVNLQRTPLAGRHFECFSEDPLLSGRMAVQYVAALQGQGVGACVKHFVANDSETERTSYVSRLTPRALREVYLAPFERVVKEAGVWMVMAAYNGLVVAAPGERGEPGEAPPVEVPPAEAPGAAPATEHRWLLRELLKDEWEFDGVVVSDWLATKSTAASARNGLDLVMPGPGGPWSEGDALLEAVRTGEVPQEDVDDKVRRILRLAERVGALSDPDGPFAVSAPAAGAGAEHPPGGGPGEEQPSGHGPATRDLLRRTAARATVVLRNEGGLLPLPPATSRIALIGANALDPFVQGGGSAHVTPPHLSRPLDALREAFPSAEVTAHRGGRTLRHAPLVAADALAGGCVELTVHDEAGRQLAALTRTAPWDGTLRPPRELPEGAAYVRAEARLRLEAPGEHLLEVAPVGAHRVEIDGDLLSESTHRVAEEVLLDASAGHPEGHVRRVAVEEPGREVTVSATAQVVEVGSFGRFARLELRHLPPEPGTDAEIEEAVAAARQAETAVVVVGTNPEAESEGWDRTDLSLPGRQHELVRRVAEANPRTVVVVNAGAPVLLPWLEDVPAVLWWWLPGQEAGGALADVLTGACEPSGRLPWTLPAAAEDVPVPDGVPCDGVVDYAEDLDVGHRGWDRLGREPAREFGFGLGYADWSYGRPSAGAWREGEPLEVAVPVTNTGGRSSREVVQVYLEPPRGAGGPRRPLRSLAGFTVVEAAPGETVRAAVAVEPRAFQVWDEGSGSWHTPEGEYRLLTAHSSRDVRGEVSVRAGAGARAPG
ncbi:beta-glucosidase family protein [Streptomyces marispadix]|uniref:Glycoside hydrolase family 3 C-terminal domain-containing protein n=1 Tax=Streptomyces marispadix TaxID=2922868 RepID=A0ABS9T2N7_9ACTN|nr:glycoside hydrolase family 3 protein [Streptomyces marispadix]MCH6162790.1 glycoside hydrolase family 3 C-terminal domain-containing protein [Streptomyces marispadix]